MPNLILCPTCATPLPGMESCCPTCCKQGRSATSRSAAALMGAMGLTLVAGGLVGCGDKAYGVPDTGWDDAPVDADNDGWDDIHEWNVGPSRPDFDGDALSDYIDVDSDNDTVYDIDEEGGSNRPVAPLAQDTDGDGDENRVDVDDDLRNVRHLLDIEIDQARDPLGGSLHGLSCTPQCP